MGLFGSKTQQPGVTEQGAPGVDTITGASTQPTITETAPGSFAVPIITDPSMGTPASEALPTMPVIPDVPIAPATPGDPLEASTGTDSGEPVATTPDPLATLNNTFGGAEPVPITPVAPTVITPGEELNPLEATPIGQEEILANGQSAAGSDGSLPAELGSHAVLGDQQPAITAAMPGESVVSAPGSQIEDNFMAQGLVRGLNGEGSSLPDKPALPEEAIIQPAGNSVDMGTVREAFETRDALKEALRGAQEAIRVALDKIEESPESKSGGE